MLNRLSKNKYSGGVYLKYILPLFAFIQCCNAETDISKTEQFKHFVYEADWRANAGYYDNNKQKDKW